MVLDVLFEHLELRRPLLVVSRDVLQLLDDQVAIPDSIRELFSRKKVSIEIEPEYEALREVLLERSK